MSPFLFAEEDHPVQRLGLERTEKFLEVRIRNVAADVGECPLDPVKSPGWVFLSKAKNQVDDHLTDAWATQVLSFVARVPFLSDERAMPTQDRIRREQRADFLETFATEDLALDRESTPLVVAQQDCASLPDFSFSTWFSVRRSSITSCCWRLTQPLRMTE